jgi:hypothetical protein
MPRLRNRVRRRVAAPIEEPGADEGTEPEDETDQEQPEDESGRPDPTARALQEDAYRRRTSNGGELGDIAPSEISDLSQQVTTGTAASVSIADQFDPGFTRTEIVNRLGMVLSLQFSYDYGSGEWVPDPIDRTESQAIEQQLAEDRATDDLTAPAETDANTEVDSNGDLKLSEGNAPLGSSIGEPNVLNRSPYYDGLDFTPSTDLQQLVVEWSFPGTVPEKVAVRNEPTGNYLYDGPISYPRQTFNVSLLSGENYGVFVRSQPGAIDENVYPVDSFPIVQDELEVNAGLDYANNDYDNIYNITGIGTTEASDIGTATTSFDNPCTATSTRSAQYDVCSRSKDVTVDLFEGDPDDPDSILLRDDINQREDITAIPDSRTDLQYRITIERGPDGDSPKVSRLGHQLIR